MKKRFLAAFAAAMCSSVGFAQSSEIESQQALEAFEQTGQADGASVPSASVPTPAARGARTVESSPELSVADGMISLLTNFPLHLQAGLELGGVWQNYATFGTTLIRSPLAPSLSLDLSIGLDLPAFIISGFFNLKPEANLRIDNNESLESVLGSSEAVGGLAWLIGGKFLWKVDSYGYTALGLFAGYYHNHVNIRDSQTSEMIGRGFLAGPEFRFRPFAPAAVTGKLGAGLEWTHLTPASTGNEVERLGSVVMASLGIAWSWNNEPKTGAYEQAFDAFGRGLSEKAPDPVEHAPAASATVQHQEEQIEEESAAKSDSSPVLETEPIPVDETESTPLPAPSAEETVPASQPSVADEPLTLVETIAERKQSRLNRQPLWNEELAKAAERQAADLSANPQLIAKAGTEFCLKDSQRLGCGHRGSDNSLAAIDENNDRRNKRIKGRVNTTDFVFDGENMVISENAACGQDSVREVMNAWMKSDRHRSNILNATITQMGAARVGNCWVQVFSSQGPPEEPVPNS